MQTECKQFSFSYLLLNMVVEILKQS